jgi:hypothetical protein
MVSADIFSAAQGPMEEESYPGQTWRDWKEVPVQPWCSPYNSDGSIEQPTMETDNNDDDDDDDNNDNNNDNNNDDNNDDDHDIDDTDNTNFATEAKCC